MNLGALDKFEDELIEKYKINVDDVVSKLSDKKFKALLLQRRWQSYAFTPLYDFGIDSVSSEKAKKVLRAIRNEEYPGTQPSHRELLVHDLLITGLKLGDVINSESTKETEKSIKAQFDFLKMKEEQDLHEIKVVTFLRFALEVLVSAEYGIFVKRMKKFGLTRKNSRFYWQHHMHDIKKEPLGSAGKTHSDRLASILVEMLDNEKKIDFCQDVTRKSFELRLGIFKQFKK